MIEDYNNGKRVNIFEEEFKLFLLSFSGQIKSFMRDEIQKITANSTTSNSANPSTSSPDASSPDVMSPNVSSLEIPINNEN